MGLREHAGSVYHVAKLLRAVGPRGGRTGEPQGALGTTGEDWGVLEVTRLPTPPPYNLLIC